MAAAPDPVQALREEITCSICLNDFTDPVMIVGCGHNFCRACITKSWNDSLKNVSCPQCRKTFSEAKLQLNRNVLEKTQLWSQIPKEPISSDNLCNFHKQPLDLFCRKDWAPICAMCKKHHRDHTVIPIEEAVKEQKGQIQSRLETLKKKRDFAEKTKEAAETATKHLLERTGRERQGLVAEVEKICQVLKDQVHFLFPRLGELENGILKKKEENDSKYSREITRLNGLISAVEEMYNQPWAEFLKGTTLLNSWISEIEETCNQLRTEYTKEFSSTTDWYGEEQFEQNTLGDLENRCEKITETNIAVKNILQKCKDKMVTELWNARDDDLEPYEKEMVVLDRDTAHTLLILSEDQDSAWVDIEEWEEMPYHPKRFDKYHCVLGSQGYTSGRFFWEVDVEEGKQWAVGVARESVERKNRVCFGPENGIWGLGLDRVGLDRGYLAFTPHKNTPLNLSEPLKRIQVYLDYTAGEVSFFNAATKTCIFTFPPATFGGEEIYPWFFILEGRIKICPLEEEDIKLKVQLIAASARYHKPWELDGFCSLSSF
ncbi:zinc finger protein RFP-like [Rhineura floridana]|uniref:zinc finger protein RFP-like n=1 Tax=Rhineura floridana TaxID=261503 RepID=UPI002AC7ED38|nr:zinc finger protein RFP-like [Rhineura floridana]